MSKPEYSFNCGLKLTNFLKNRYRDILPCKIKFYLFFYLFNYLDDANRVILKTSDSNFNDYINASYIFYPDVQTKYIAAQAPLSTTLNDFWSMIFEHSVNIILMLCNCIENGIVYCFCFFFLIY